MAKIMDTEGGAGQATRALEIDPGLAPASFEPAAPQPGSGVTAEAAESPAPARRSRLRPLIMAAVAVVVLGGLGMYGYEWWTNGRFMVSTDDAYVAADTATVTSKVAGYVKSVPAPDNTRVQAGDPLVILDDADYRIALAQAEAQIRTGEAGVSRIEQQILAAEAAVVQAQAQVASATAAAINAEAQFNRVNSLAANDFATNASLDKARAERDQARQAVNAAQAALDAAKANLNVLRAQKTEAERTLDQYNLARDQAQLNLDHATIRAPFDGVVGNGAAEPGEYVQPGQRLVAVVPLDAVYVDANFKETQVAELKAGQQVAVTIDAYPDRTITGTVVSVAPASGSVFSLLPPDNASGNFTKIVQRIPVRIRLPESVTAEGLIRPGMSVVADVDTRTGDNHQVAAAR